MKYLLIFTILIGLGASAQAQDWKERKRQMEERVQLKLKSQKARVDKKFADQMRRVWSKMELSEADLLPQGPKPVEPETFDPKALPSPDRNTEIEVITIPAPLPANMPISIPDDDEIDDEPVDDTPELIAKHTSALQSEMVTDFFGNNVHIRYDRRMRLESLQRLSESKIADAWEKLDASQSELLIYQLHSQARLMRLNDWGYLQLVNKTAKELYPQDKNMRTLFNWFVLVKSGYMSTVCFNSKHLFLMVAADRTLYGQRYLSGGNGVKYYVLDLDGGKPNVSLCQVFNGQHPQGKRKLSFDMRRAPRLPLDPMKRTLKFTYKNKLHTINITLNRNVQRYYNSMPFLDFDVYMQAPLSASVTKSLLTAIKPHLQGMSEREAAEFLLRFVQTAFHYKTDREQFGNERYLFAEETLFYPYSDCEDRSALYIYLVRKLLHLKAIGLIFPGHAATAVQFTHFKKGDDSLTWRRAKFTICDPTYVNASCGNVLPQVRGKKARVVEI